jgi:hypothetical protein
LYSGIAKLKSLNNFSTDEIEDLSVRPGHADWPFTVCFNDVPTTDHFIDIAVLELQLSYRLRFATIAGFSRRLSYGLQSVRCLRPPFFFCAFGGFSTEAGAI